MIHSRLTPEHLLESLVRLTQERSQDSLETSLINTMLELLPAQEIALVRVIDGNTRQVEEILRARRDTGGISFEETLAPDTELAACLEPGYAAGAHERCGDWLYYPITVRDRVCRIVMFRCEACSTAERGLLEGFLSIYRNYLELLYDSECDTLTGLLNRKTFDARIGRILAEEADSNPWNTPGRMERRRGSPLDRHWMGIFDIDHFKRINDTHGHLYGDEVLLLLAQIMRETFRAGDLMFRYGGEEFIVVLRCPDRRGALAALERFRRNVANYQFPQVGQVTVSIGVVQISAEDVPSDVVGRADQALYYAKAHGRNCLHSYEQLVEQGELKASTVKDDIELF